MVISNGMDGLSPRPGRSQGAARGPLGNAQGGQGGTDFLIKDLRARQQPNPPSVLGSDRLSLRDPASPEANPWQSLLGDSPAPNAPRKNVPPRPWKAPW